MKQYSLFLLCLLGAACFAQENRNPNVILILADDQGWNALSVRADPSDPASGSPYFKTPKMANLAKEGMRFSHAYSPAPTCSPTRHSIQFGRSPASLKIWGADGIKDWDALAGESLANVVRKARPEYTCAHFGKWHIGQSPETLGYKVNDGGNGNGVGNSKNPKDPKLIFSLSRKSMEFMEKQAQEKKPFFLQVSHYANHLKYQGLKETIGKYETEHTDDSTEYHKDPLWAAMNENLDSGIGMILDKLEELNIADNTYVFYTADNGYESKRDFKNTVAQRGFYKAFPQRSHKYHVSEGGIRVPFIVRGPGIQAGSHSSSPVVGTDLFPTVLSLIGAADKIPARVEGADLSEHLKSAGEKAIERKDPFLVFKFSKPRPPHDIAIVQEKHKLIKDLDTGESFLFNLQNDIGESKDLSGEKPELARQLNQQMTDYFARFGWDESKINKQGRRKGKGSKLASVPDNVTEPKKKTGSGEKKPNVVIIFIDDMGYGDIGPFGSDHPTPHLDRMAKEGMKLTDFYVSSTACTPSRSALLTGCYADRIGMGKSVVFPADSRGLNPKEITIAEILKKAGYATGCFGKWHLGDQPAFMPLAQGFDEYEGIPYSNDMWVRGNPKRKFPPLPWIKGNKPVAQIPDQDNQALITDAVTDAAVHFINQNKDKPFFCYIPHSAVHSPHMVTPSRLTQAKDDVMEALVGEIDASTGRILNALRKGGIDQDTLVLFTNDNGGAGKTSSGPLRGHKFGPKYEGHMRVSTLAWWPGKIPAGTVSSEIMATIDVLPTVAKLAGQPVPKDRIIDGHDVSKILLGQTKAKSPHETLYYEKDGIRQGKWKLVRYKVKADRFAELYDLEKDLGERNDLSKQHPEKVKELISALDAHVEKLESEIRTAGYAENPKPLLADSKGVPTLLEWRRKRSPAKPNVVLMFIDDMGYGDIGPFGSKINKTPHLDRMAAEGLKFTDFYNASQNCTPSRAALLTGCYAKRVGMDGRVCFPNVPKALNPSEYTMAEMFKDAGYATGCFGKWHLGHRPGYLPNDHGFDAYEGIPYSNDMWAPYDPATKLWKKSKDWQTPLPWMVDGKSVAVVKNATDQSLLTHATTKAALNFIREQGRKKEPFFAYLPYAAVHLPRVGHPDFLPAGAPTSKANKTGVELTVHLKAQVEELDAAVGQVFSALKEQGVENNTIVLFMSDNGGSRGTSMGPLKGGKGSLYEGGPRTPFLIHWPGFIPAGKVSHEIGVSSDLLPTLAKLCGGKLSGNKMDGRDLSDLFLRPDTAKSPHEGFAHKGQAYRLGKWKMVGKQLFDLEKDLGEKRNVAKENPEVLKKLSDKTNKFFSVMETEVRPHANMPDPSPIIDEQQAHALPNLDKWLKEFDGYNHK